eukprot:1495852-Rhodomonas_salina.3
MRPPPPKQETVWVSAKKPAAALACVLLCLVAIFLGLVLAPHQCGPKKGQVLDPLPEVIEVDKDAACPAGLGRGIDGICVQCERGSYNDGTFTACQPCPVGFYADQKGQSSCSECGPGTSLTTPGVGYADPQCVCARDTTPYAIPSGTCAETCLCRETEAGQKTITEAYCSDGSSDADCACRSQPLRARQTQNGSKEDASHARKARSKTSPGPLLSRHTFA